MRRLISMMLVIISMTMMSCAQAQSNNTSDENFKLYETTNMWTFLKLDTRTGKIWQVQYSVEGPDYRFETALNTMDFTSNSNAKAGRFELYKTQNIHNFILLDKYDGRVWQVQWGNAESRQVLPILNYD